ncbi:hypothetical protein ACIA8O_18620 [Kitasatospora sp. NPDC051853]|uniref:hypothetical protein n=1 Tax=Kitasatospora sp. NPDC051853 TaxID=3364058 RepID=UPI0037907282
MTGPALSGCSLSAVYVLCVGEQPAGITSADLAGAYRGDPNGRLTLAADGTVTVSDWSHRVHGTSGKVVRIAHASGTWALRETTAEDGILEVVMTLDAEGGTVHEYANIGGSRKKPELVYHLGGDPDSCETVDLARAE